MSDLERASILTDEDEDEVGRHFDDDEHGSANEDDIDTADDVTGDGLRRTATERTRRTRHRRGGRGLRLRLRLGAQRLRRDAENVLDRERRRVRVERAGVVEV